MKTALQEAEDAEVDGAENDGRPRLKDNKGREILSPEERAKKEEKERIKAEKDKQKSAEASVSLSPVILKFINLFFSSIESSCKSGESQQTGREFVA